MFTPKIPPFPMGENPGVSYGSELIGHRMADATNLVDTNLTPFVEHSITLREGGGFKVIVDAIEYVPKPSEPSYTFPTAPGKIMDGMEMVKHVFSNLTAEQRKEVFNGYCCVCGSDNPMCPCEGDE